jgi:hypothetical protein
MKLIILADTYLSSDRDVPVCTVSILEDAPVGQFSGRWLGFATSFELEIEVDCERGRWDDSREAWWDHGSTDMRFESHKRLRAVVDALEYLGVYVEEAEAT